MAKIINLAMDVPPNRQLQVTVPDDFPIGPAKLVLISGPDEECSRSTLGDLLVSEYFGMWRDRKDIGGSAEFAQQLRTEAWKRKS